MGSTIQQENDKKLVFGEDNSHEKWKHLSKDIGKRICADTHTHTQHKCVPFLLARSSFRGLSKNMASEEDAFERQKKQKTK